MKFLAALFLCAALVSADPARQIRSIRAASDFELSTDPNSELWSVAPGVVFSQTATGGYVDGNATEVRSRWTPQNLYFLVISHYKNMSTHLVYDRKAETKHLYDADVAQIFLGPDTPNPEHYYEFEVSPHSEFADAEWNWKNHGNGDWDWNSGMTVKSVVNSEGGVWYAAVKIPVASLLKEPAQKGRTFRVNFAKMQGDYRTRVYLSWQVTKSGSFHSPDDFGTLLLDETPEPVGN